MTLGKLPDEWWNSWDNRGEEFEEDGSYKLDPDCPEVTGHMPLRERLEEMRLGVRGEKPEMFESKEMDALELLFSKILRYLPEDRVSAEEIVRLLPTSWERGEAA
jgi:serine/threonine-protein kinase SRPK3